MASGPHKLTQSAVSEYALSLLKVPHDSRPRTTADYAPRKVFLPGNAKVEPVRGLVNSETYLAPQCTMDLFYVDGVRKGILDGTLKRCVGHCPSPVGATLSAPQTTNHVNNFQRTPHQTKSAPVHNSASTPVMIFHPQDDSDSDDDVPPEDHKDSLVVNGRGARSRSSLTKARECFFMERCDDQLKSCHHNSDISPQLT